MTWKIRWEEISISAPGFGSRLSLTRASLAVSTHASTQISALRPQHCADPIDVLGLPTEKKREKDRGREKERIREQPLVKYRHVTCALSSADSSACSGQIEISNTVFAGQRTVSGAYVRLPIVTMRSKYILVIKYAVPKDDVSGMSHTVATNS